MAVLFISETFLKENTPVNLNVDVKDTYSHVQAAQDLYITDVLGIKLSDQLKASIAAVTTTQDEKDLLEYVQKALVWWTLYLAFPFLNFKVKNKSVQKSHSENGEAADLSELKWLRDDIKNRAEYYQTRVRDFLMLNVEKFSAYSNPDQPVLPNRRTGFDSGMFFERTRGTWGDDCPPIDIQDLGIHPIN